MIMGWVLDSGDAFELGTSASVSHLSPPTLRRSSVGEVAHSQLVLHSLIIFLSCLYRYYHTLFITLPPEVNSINFV